MVKALAHSDKKMWSESYTVQGIFSQPIYPLPVVSWLLRLNVSLRNRDLQGEARYNALYTCSPEHMVKQDMYKFCENVTVKCARRQALKK